MQFFDQAQFSSMSAANQLYALMQCALRDLRKIGINVIMNLID